MMIALVGLAVLTVVFGLGYYDVGKFGGSGDIGAGLLIIIGGGTTLIGLGLMIADVVRPRGRGPERH